MPTSGCRSCVPPNHAATSAPSLVSAIVEAWQLGNGALSKMNSDPSRAACAKVGGARTVVMSTEANQTAGA